MALRLRFQYSLDYGTLGAGATWTQFADIADGGAPGDVLFSSPTLGVPYWYRVQRYDTDSGLTSEWSDVYQYTATSPIGTTKMNQIDPCDIITAADLKFGVAFESFPGVPSKARWLARCEGGYITRQIGRRYGKVRAGNRARYRSAAKGRYSYGGKLRFAFTPERAIPTMLGTALPIVTTALTAPTRYSHAFSNNKTCRTATIWVQHSPTIVFCYPGVVVSAFSFAPSLGSSDVLDVEFDVVATDGFVLQGATALADSGMNVAVMDLLPEYSQEDFVLSMNGNSSGFTDFTVAADLDLTEIMQRPWHAPVGFYNKGTGLKIDGQSYFQGLAKVASDMGYSATPAGNFGAVCTVPLAAIDVTANPCAPAGQAFANVFALTIPKADVVASEDAGEAQGDFTQSISVTPIFDEAGSLGTDFSMSIVNSQTNAQLTQPGAAFDPLKIPSSNARPYTYDKVGAGATTTNIPLASVANPNIDQVDAAYVGHTVVIIKASDGTRQTGTVATYTAPTGIAAGSLVLSAAITAPSAGDVVIFL